MRRGGLRPLLVCALLTAAAPAAADTPYRVDFTGLAAAPLVATLRNDSQLVALMSRPPPSDAALRRRAMDDLPRLQGAMHAAGYWQARVVLRIDTARHPAVVTVAVTPGPLFHYGTITFALANGASATLVAARGPAAFGLSPGAPALSASVEAANAAIVTAYENHGHPFARIVERKVVVDVATATMSVTYVIDPGLAARFGPAMISGLKRVDRAFIVRRIAWTEAAPYDARLVEATRQTLVRSGLFSSVRVDHAAAVAADGELPMTIDLIEAPPRSIGAGAGYNTNLGFGGQTFWEDRNLFGEGEDLKLQAGASQRQLGVFGTFRRPDFVKPGLDLLANAELLRENTDAYRSRRWLAYTGLEERAYPPYVFGGGVSIERAYLTETSRDENYLLLGLPFYIRRDTTDNLLNPTEGTRVNLTLTPYRGLVGRDLEFLSSRIEGRAYQRLGGPDTVLAGYAALGSIVGASLAGLPADKRLYAGGAGSVRGYAYQLAGPLDSADVPIGGRSSLEMGIELRQRITPTIGLVPFIDAGNVFPSNLPNRLSLFYGAGIGLRYYTVVGPIRLDLAFPIEKRPVDSPIQVYVSIGQAF